MFKLLTWNVAKRVKFKRQTRLISGRKPDVVALQEVSYLRPHEIAAALESTGLRYYAYSRLNEGACFKHGVMLLSRWPLIRCELFEVPCRESALGVVVSAPFGDLHVFTAHVPNGSTYGVLKDETLEGIYSRLTRSEPTYRVLCGDFNTPQAEFEDGTVVTFGQRMTERRGIVQKNDGGRRDRAERSIVQGLQEFDLRDAFRATHGYGARASSWRDARLDHIFASAALKVVSIQYLHKSREERLSDHSALEAIFSPSH